MLTLRTNNQVKGETAVRSSNNIGLKDDNISPKKSNGEYRIAFIGALTVMGGFCRE